jgi:hypothetical protein
MKKLTMILLSIFFMIPSVLSAAEAQEALIAKAKAEGKVTFYANITAIEPVMEAFTKKYGVKGEYTRVSTDKFVATVSTEHEAGKLMADVLQAPEGVNQDPFGRGWLMKVRNPQKSSNLKGLLSGNLAKRWLEEEILRKVNLTVSLRPEDKQARPSSRLSMPLR